MPKPLKILSLFDGISCGQVALERAGIPEDIIRDFGRKNLVDIICEYKKMLQAESEG